MLRVLKFRPPAPPACAEASAAVHPGLEVKYQTVEVIPSGAMAEHEECLLTLPDSKQRYAAICVAAESANEAITSLLREYGFAGKGQEYRVLMSRSQVGDNSDQIGPHTFAAFQKGDGGNNYIQINAELNAKRSPGAVRATLAHELIHALVSRNEVWESPGRKVFVGGFAKWTINREKKTDWVKAELTRFDEAATEFLTLLACKAPPDPNCAYTKDVLKLQACASALPAPLQPRFTRALLMSKVAGSFRPLLEFFVDEVGINSPPGKARLELFQRVIVFDFEFILSRSAKEQPESLSSVDISPVVWK